MVFDRQVLRPKSMAMYVAKAHACAPARLTSHHSVAPKFKIVVVIAVRLLQHNLGWQSHGTLTLGIVHLRREQRW